MREVLAAAWFVGLGVDDYLADFTARFDRPGAHLWKLERRLTFQEPGYPTWDAFAAGRVAESIALAEAQRPDIMAYQDGLSRRGIVTRRVRIVATPPTSYLWWEAHILKIMDEAGELIRTLDVASISDHERDGWTLPEIVTLGDTVLYSVRYDRRGILTGADRYQDPVLVKTWIQFIAELFQRGEPFADYYRRDIAPTDHPGAFSPASEA